ncbi:MAG: nicotinate-nucleotide--dimethylbenzimidazole phosphoribosyltransferase [Micromonosporaceae bacterium]
MTLAESLDIPLPDDAARTGVAERLARLDLPGAGFGGLTDAISWAAGVQGTANPASFSQVRVMLLAGDHAGGIAAGASPDESSRRARAELAGTGPIARLAAQAGATLELVDAGLAGEPLAPDSTTRVRDGAAPIDTDDACTAEQAADGFALGRRLADSIADSGVDLMLVASLGAGAEVAAAAAAAYLTGAEPPGLLARVTGPDGRIDDAAWMRRCAALRDALSRVRHRPHDPHTALAALGGPALAVATGLVLGAAARRTPVVLDGPVGLTAALLARDIAGQVSHWCMAPDTSRHPTSKMVANWIGLEPFFDLRLDLGEGAAALTTLPVLQSALALAHTTEPAPSSEAAE